MDRVKLAAIGGFIVAIIVLITASAMYGTRSSTPEQYSVVIDAGSSHSQFFVYKWMPTPYDVTAEVSPVQDVHQVPFECGEKPGISFYDTIPSLAGDSLTECLKNASKVIPAGQHHKTFVYLRATAGMRVLNDNAPDIAEAVLDSVRKEFAKSPFGDVHATAEILPGYQEGAFGWVTANYLDGLFTNDTVKQERLKNSRTLGALDLGGASTQITFVPSDLAKKTMEIHLYGDLYDIYTYSYLCYGADKTRQRLLTMLLVANGDTGDTIDNPCYPGGYNFTIPASTVEEWSTDVCSRDLNITNNLLGRDFSFIGTDDANGCGNWMSRVVLQGQDPKLGSNTPPVGDKTFFAFSAYYYFIDYFCNYPDFKTSAWCTTEGVPESYSPTPNEVDEMSTKLCDLTLAELEDGASAYLKDKPDLLSAYCYQAMYVSLLLDNYRFPDETNQIYYVSAVKGDDVGWTLGFMLAQTTIQESIAGGRRISGGEFGALLFVSLLIAGISAVFFFGRPCKNRRMESQPLIDDGETSSYVPMG